MVRMVLFQMDQQIKVFFWQLLIFSYLKVILHFLLLYYYNNRLYCNIQLFEHIKELLNLLPNIYFHYQLIRINYLQYGKFLDSFLL